MTKGPQRPQGHQKGRQRHLRNEQFISCRKALTYMNAKVRHSS
jgi:hypothetical protein